MTEKSSNEIARNKFMSAKSIEIRSASPKSTIKSSIDKCILTKNSSINLEKMRRTNSAPPHRQNVAARMHVNILINASDHTEVTDKSINCGKCKTEKIL